MFDRQTTNQLIALAKAGDASAKEKLLADNQSLLKCIVRRYLNKGVEYDDLYQLAGMGLLKAVNGFDPAYGVRFSTYAVPMIAGEIKRFMRDDGSIKVSRSLKELGLRVSAARERHLKLYGTELTVPQLAQQLGESAEAVALAIQASMPAMSLTPESDDGDDRQLDIPVASPEEELSDRISLEEVLAALPEEDQKLIRLRFYAGRTQSDTARLLHTTQVQISRRERRILQQMRARLLEE